MKRRREIAKPICTDDEIRLYRRLNPSVQMSKSVRTDEFNGFTQRIYSFHTTDLLVSHNGFSGFSQRI